MKYGLLLASLVACGVPDRAPHPSADAVAAAIEAALPSMRRDTVTVFDLSLEGATIDAAYQGDALRRLHVALLGESGRAWETYYYDRGLVLVVRVDARYDAPLSGRVVDSTVQRFDLTPAHLRHGLVDSLEASARAHLGRLAAPTRASPRDG